MFISLSAYRNNVSNSLTAHLLSDYLNAFGGEAK
jgi:hypothetical protein